MAIRRVVGVSLPSELWGRLSKLAKAKGVSRSELMESFCRDGLAGTSVQVRLLNKPELMEGFVRVLAAPGMVRVLSEAMRDALTPAQLRLFEKELGAVEASMKVRRS